MHSLCDWLSSRQQKKELDGYLYARAKMFLDITPFSSSMKYWLKPAKVLKKMLFIISREEKMFREKIRLTFVCCYNDSRDKFFRRVLFTVILLTTNFEMEEFSFYDFQIKSVFCVLLIQRQLCICILFFFLCFIPMKLFFMNRKKVIND